MLADGKIAAEELAMLGAIGKRLGITRKMLAEILDNPPKDNFAVPEDDKEKIAQLMDVVAMMAIDGNIDPNEMCVCRTIAVIFGYNSEIIDNVVDCIADSIKNGHDREQVIIDIQQTTGK